MQWSNARTTCHRLDADLAVFSEGDSMQALAQLHREIKLEDEDLFVGLSGSKLRWLWLDGENVSNTDDLWGPNEPSGDGKCGSLLIVRRNSEWDGWRWNDLPCSTNLGYICEQPLGMHVTHLVGKPVFHVHLCWVETNSFAERLALATNQATTIFSFCCSGF